MARTTLLVQPSRHQRMLLVALYLLLLWPVAGLIAGWQWALLLPIWLLALSWSWRLTRVAPLELIWDGQWLVWQGRRYGLGRQSRILPGVLRLSLLLESNPTDAMSTHFLDAKHDGRGKGDGLRQLWIFSDALPPEHYRLLARAIHFLGAAKPR
ncbi:MAG: protein YgfX [Aeromonas sp.]